MICCGCREDTKRACWGCFWESCCEGLDRAGQVEESRVESVVLSAGGECECSPSRGFSASRIGVGFGGVGFWRREEWGVEPSL